MAVAVFASGTQTTTVTTEHFLGAATAAGVYVFNVDLNPMAAGDVFELRCYRTALGSGVERLYLGPVTIMGASQALLGVFYTSVPVVLDATSANMRFSLKQTFGSTRDIPWSLLSL